MSNFSDREDRDLVRLAKVYEDEGVNVSWAQVAQRMKYSKKSAVVLKQRLCTLKRTHGKLIQDFPARFFQCQPRTCARSWGKPSVRLCELQPRPRSSEPHVLFHAQPATTLQAIPVAIPQVLLPVATPPAQAPETECLLQSFNALIATIDVAVSDGALKQKLTSSSSVAPPLSQSSAHVAVTGMFASVRRSDVRQSSGRAEQNVGELSFLGVVTLIEACQLTSSDTFLDVGAGIGNVVTQVALQTRVKLAIGIEIRVDVAVIGQDIISTHQARDFPQLER
jgi:hypothetical protein